MSSDATAGQEPDMYGQLHPLETAELLATKLKEFEEEIHNIPPEEKMEWMQAEVKCPESLVGEAFKLQFLRCEVFNADLAAQRFVKYWKKRLEIFGPEKAFGPISISEGLSEDQVALGLGVMTLLPSRDPSGRSIVYWDPAHLDSSKYSTDSMVRAFWYVLHAAMEPVEAQQKGILVLVDPQRASMSQFDSSMGKLFTSAMSGVLPLRMSGIHICYPPYFVSMVLPLVKVFMPERMQKRILFHSGSMEDVTRNFDDNYGLSLDRLPCELGGTLEWSHQDWLEKRRKEGK